jgi:PII-like signaling protein
MTSKTVTRKRIEILVDAPLAQRLIRAAADVGISGYTLIPVQSGAGHSGTWRDDQVSGASTKLIFLTIASEDKAEKFVSLLAPRLTEYSMLLTLSDVQVVRGERF